MSFENTSSLIRNWANTDDSLAEECRFLPRIAVPVAGALDALQFSLAVLQEQVRHAERHKDVGGTLSCLELGMMPEVGEVVANGDALEIELIPQFQEIEKLFDYSKPVKTIVAVQSPSLKKALTTRTISLHVAFANRLGFEGVSNPDVVELARADEINFAEDLLKKAQEFDQAATALVKRHTRHHRVLGNYFDARGMVDAHDNLNYGEAETKAVNHMLGVSRQLLFAVEIMQACLRNIENREREIEIVDLRKIDKPGTAQRLLKGICLGIVFSHPDIYEAKLSVANMMQSNSPSF